MDRARPEPTIELIGRDLERARVDAFIDGISAGPCALAIRGEPGIGKTALWRYGLERARGHGFEVLQTRPAEEEMPLPLVGIVDLLERLDVDRSAVDPDADPASRGRAVLDALRGLAANGPILMAVDDAQWLDSVSAKTLRFALRRLDAEPVGVLATIRVGDDPDPLALAGSVPQDRQEAIELGPLEMPDLRRVMSGTVAAISRPTLRRIYEVSGGNPLYAIELARGLEAGERPEGRSTDLSLTDSLQAAIVRRLEAVPPDLVAVLRTASALGPTSVHELRTVLPDAGLDEQLEILERRAMLVVDDDLEVRFSHPLIGSAVYSGMSPLERRSLHAHLASETADPEVRARHLARSADRPDPDIARLLEEAAGRAIARGAFDLAAEFAGHSLRLTPPEDADAARRRALEEIDNFAAAGESRRALALADRLVASMRPGPGRAEALIKRYAIENDDMVTAETLLEQALADAGDDELLRGRVLELLGRQRRYMGDLVGAIDFVGQALAIAEQAGDARVQMSTSASLAYYSALSGAPRPALMERALELERKLGAPLLYAGPRLLLAKQLLWSGDVDAARALFEAALTEAVRAGNDVWREQALYDLGLLEAAVGDLATAEERVREGIQATRDAEDPSFERLFLYPQALVEAWSGRADVARATIARLLELESSQGGRDGTARAHGVLGLLALSESDAIGAARELGEAVRLLDSMGVAYPGAYPGLPDAIEAAAISGDILGAAALLDRLERQADAVDSEWARAAVKRARGALLLSGGEPDGAVEVLKEAALSFDELGFRPDAARALLLEGRALLRGGHRSHAAEVLADARERFDAMGATLWEARAAEDLERASPGRTAGQLTPAEERVAALVARGMKNREIASELYMGVATVEAHLTRIYRKLDIRSRSELVRLVAEGLIVVPDAPEEEEHAGSTP